MSARCRTSEVLEPRTLLAVVPAPSPALDAAPSVHVRIDYSLDTNRFFDTQQKRDLLQQAADSVVKWFKDQLPAINPVGGNTWDAKLDHPATGNQISIRNLAVGQNEIVLFAGGRDMTDALGRGGPGGFNANGATSWLDLVARRGQRGSPEFGPWGGAIAFDTNPSSPWSFGDQSPTDASNDFLSVATHEVTHVMGFGTSDAWRQLSGRNGFVGAASDALFGSPVPLDPDDASHWAEGTRIDGQGLAMDPQLTTGTRRLLTPLDYAALDDIGWDMPPHAGLTSAPPVTAPSSTFTDFTVTFSHYAMIDAATLSSPTGISMIGPAGEALPVTFQSAQVLDSGRTRAATYRLEAPGGTWDAPDNGTYSVVLGNGVRSDTGEAVAPGALGTINVDVAAPPAAVLQPVDAPAPGAPTQAIRVLYTDGVTVDPASVDANDIAVTDPGGVALPVVSAAVDDPTPGPQRIGTYVLAAPGGTWDPADDGIYTVTLRAGEVRDTGGNASPAAALGTFEVSLGTIVFNAHTPATYPDASGGLVRVTLKGPGTGRLRFGGARPADADALVLDGTTATSTVIVKAPPSGTTIHGVTVNGDLKALTAKAVNLAGDLAATGSVGAIRLRSTAAGHAITAASVGSILTPAFDADVNAARVGKVKVGSLGGDILVTDSLGIVVAGLIKGARIFAGVRGDFAGTLPTAPSDFVNAAASIGVVKTRSLTASFVAAPILGRVSLRDVASGGVVADRLAAATGRTATQRFRFRNEDAPAQLLREDAGGQAFVIQIV